MGLVVSCVLSYENLSAQRATFEDEVQQLLSSKIDKKPLQTAVAIFDTQYPLPFSRESALFLREFL